MRAWLAGDLKGGVILMAELYATATRYADTVMSVISTKGLIDIDHEVALEFTPPPAAAAPATTVPAAAPAPSKPAPAPAAAAPATTTAATEASPVTNPISALASIATLAHAAMSVATGLDTAAPALAKSTQSVISSGSAVIADLGKIADDLKAGRYADTQADIQKAGADLGMAITAVEAEVGAIAALANSSTTLHSLSGIGNLLAKI